MVIYNPHINNMAVTPKWSFIQLLALFITNKNPSFLILTQFLLWLGYYFDFPQVLNVSWEVYADGQVTDRWIDMEMVTPLEIKYIDEEVPGRVHSSAHRCLISLYLPASQENNTS